MGTTDEPKVDEPMAGDDQVDDADRVNAPPADVVDAATIDPVDEPVERLAEVSRSDCVCTRSGQIVKLPQRHGSEAAAVAEVALAVPWDVLHDEEHDTQDEMQDPIAFHPFAMAASSNPDILHLGEARKATDWPRFEEAMAKEAESHEEMGHWELINRDQVPSGTKALPAIWAFQRKCRIASQEVHK